MYSTSWPKKSSKILPSLRRRQNQKKRLIWIHKINLYSVGYREQYRAGQVVICSNFLGSAFLSIFKLFAISILSLIVLFEKIVFFCSLSKWVTVLCSTAGTRRSRDRGTPLNSTRINLILRSTRIRYRKTKKAQHVTFKTLHETKNISLKM